VPREAADVLRDALALPVEARAQLVESLVERLDETAEAGGDAAARCFAAFAIA
jgi:hypothetical protein